MLGSLRKHRFFLEHSPHYEVIEIQPVIQAIGTQSQAAPFGGAPPKSVADTTQPLTYIVMVQPNGSSGYLKQVTVVVHDPRNSTLVLARQSSLFDPNVAP